jgi:H+-transporting ATPase
MLTCSSQMLNTDISQGIASSEVESRRRRFGWNELSTEKTNFLKQFLSYFQGPILYGTISIFNSKYKI